MEYNFKDKNIIITGATGGLGSKLAYEFLKLNGNIILIGKDSKKLDNLQKDLDSIKNDNQYIKTICIDFSIKNIERIIKNEIKKINIVHVLINNAAIHGPIGNFWENDFDLWKKGFQVNFYSPLIFIREIIPLMISNNKGKIINVSGGGATSSRPGFTSYAVSKTSLVRFTEIAADELKSYDIDINIIAPGSMPTNLLNEVLKYNKTDISLSEINSAKKVFKSGGSMLKAIDLCVFLSSNYSDGISGKLISALWDPWNNLKKYKNKLNKSDIYNLRRIVPKDRNEDWK